MADAARKDYYSYEDWLEMDENIRAELVDGELIMMTSDAEASNKSFLAANGPQGRMAAPEQRHQEILGEIYRQLANFLKGHPCKVFPAPFGVRLSQAEDTVFEPDIVVVCDKTKLNGKICDGVPDLVVEILSPSSIRYDRVFKFNRYLRAGVREYWIADGETNSIQVYTLNNGNYIASVYGDSDTLPVGVLEGCNITLSDVFPETPAEPAG